MPEVLGLPPYAIVRWINRSQGTKDRDQRDQSQREEPSQEEPEKGGGQGHGGEPRQQSIHQLPQRLQNKRKFDT